MNIPSLLKIQEKQKRSVLSTLLSRRMTRREFLLYGLTVMLMVTGITGFLNAIVSPHALFGKRYPKQTVGYGSSSYGGVEKKS